MEGSTTAALRNILEDLTATEGVVGSALIGFDGMTISESFVIDVNLEKIGALLSSVYNTVQRVFGEMEQDSVKETWFQTDRYGFHLHTVELGILLAVARSDTPIGLVRLSLKKAVAQLDREERRI